MGARKIVIDGTGKVCNSGVLATTGYAAAALMTATAGKLVIVGIMFQGKSSLFRD